MSTPLRERCLAWLLGAASRAGDWSLDRELALVMQVGRPVVWCPAAPWRPRGARWQGRAPIRDLTQCH